MASISQPSSADLPVIQSLLKDAGLPFEDLTEKHLDDLIVATDSSGIVGAVGLEMYGEDALLRSLVVRADRRTAGIGDQLLSAIENAAIDEDISSLVLLTTTAKDYFAKRGFREIRRDDVSLEVQSSTEFASICPASATCMRKNLAKRIAFICVENSNRSQMAQAFARRYTGIEAYSAGSKPSGKVNPRAVAMMQEKGISLTDHHSKSLDDLNGDFDVVVTMGCGDACPWIPAKQRIDWQLRDPKDVDDAEFRAIRDDIEQRVASLVHQLRAQ